MSAGLEIGHIDGGIGLTAGVGLNVDVFCAEDGFGAVDGQIFDLVHLIAPAVITFAGVAFGIFIGKDRSGRFHDCQRGVIFRRDQIDTIFLPIQLSGKDVADGRVFDITLRRISRRLKLKFEAIARSFRIQLRSCGSSVI